VLGIIADKSDARRVLAASLLCCALGTLCLLGVSEMHVGAACVGAFVLFWGTSTNSFGQLAPVILAERFGPKNLGTLIGIQFAIAGIAGALAPILTGLLYDKVADYHLAIDFSALAVFAGCVLILMIKARRPSSLQRELAYLIFVAPHMPCHSELLICWNVASSIPHLKIVLSAFISQKKTRSRQRGNIE